MRLTTPSFFFGVLSSVFILGCSKEQPQQSAANGRNQGPLPVDAFVVKPSVVSEDVEVPGSLLPYEETDIRAEIGGRVVRLNISEGSLVQKGTLLVKLFDEDLQANLKKLQVQLEINEKTEERNRELLEINAISQQEYDLSTLNVKNLKADIEATRIAISKTEIRAPYTGTLGLRNVSLGSYLSPSDIVTTIRQVDRLKLEFAIPEKYAREVGKGYVVNFRVDGGDQTHHAEVIATENSVDQATRTLRVKAVVNKKHKELVPGIFARVNLQLGKDNDALVVPTQAVIPNIRNKQVIIYKNDSVVFRVVETGIRDSAYIQIINGVQAGDTVITSGLMAIRPNARVKITKVDAL